MVVDEVKTCFGRTGKMFAVQHTGVEPDLLILGKPMASGLPLSACVGRCEILDSGFSHGFTTGANPISCAASLATIRILDKEHLVDNSARMGAHLMKRLEELKGQHEMIGDVRGKGLIAGIELVRNRNTKEPAHLETTKVCYRAWELGLIIIYLGIYANSIELTPPLVVTKEQLDTGLDILDRAFEDVERGKVSDRSLQGFDGWVR
jgi:4-aminobutyrate aminotransferase